MAVSLTVYVRDEDLAGVGELAWLKGSTDGRTVFAALATYFGDLANSGTASARVQASGTAPVRAVSTVTMSSTGIANDQTIVLGDYTLTAKTSGAVLESYQFNRSDTISVTLTNLAALINQHSVLSKLFSASATATTCVITCLNPGLLGNSLTFTTAASNTTLNGSGNTGGTTAGAGVDDATGIICVANGATTF